MKHLLTAFALTLGLSGCATRWVVDSEVRSFSSLQAVPAGATYRFERLPSQQASEAQQQQLEEMAGPALERAGLRRDDANAQYTAQIGARVTAELSPWADPWYYQGGLWPGYYRNRPWGYGAGWYGRGWYGGGWYGPAFTPPANPWYAREVSVVLRELPSNRVVYETRARNDGPYNRSAAVLPVMFQAALQGFPTPPAGERRVDIEIPTSRN
ncbi:DUF4136 domain-containing protein [Variovorax sp. KK3]|uniref:DUF4136 domain-containing protein n=1 Tax=Variovorax sp. KK3 TaxID=1855728 RepID=UPI00097BB544|nr:DUF4136 domain-containing protein [Variovorax sp. KK3]